MDNMLNHTSELHRSQGAVVRHMIGHLVPGMFFLFVSVYMNVACWYKKRMAVGRGREIDFLESQKLSDDSTRNPEENIVGTNDTRTDLSEWSVRLATLERRAGTALICACLIGILIEGIGGVASFGNFFFQSEHIAMYAAFLPAVILFEKMDEKGGMLTEEKATHLGPLLLVVCACISLSRLTQK
uniref:Uncharacterized protein n=1 Tax=Mucochytrium quahogii TaxID=96639 RepID=A0A7S2WBR0_9STRA|mmetsp:Transcript_18384/g.39841  ORF Transcript_18384/g.39841 Transcript_18384/m.39841 type:complete len:185 (+) Transcript_18384:281-835(+)